MIKVDDVVRVNVERTEKYFQDNFATTAKGNNRYKKLAGKQLVVTEATPKSFGGGGYILKLSYQGVSLEGTYNSNLFDLVEYGEIAKGADQDIDKGADLDVDKPLQGKSDLNPRVIPVGPGIHQGDTVELNFEALNSMNCRCMAKKMLDTLDEETYTVIDCKCGMIALDTDYEHPQFWPAEVFTKIEE